MLYAGPERAARLRRKGGGTAAVVASQAAWGWGWGGGWGWAIARVGRILSQTRRVAWPTGSGGRRAFWAGKRAFNSRASTGLRRGRGPTLCNPVAQAGAGWAAYLGAVVGEKEFGKIQSGLLSWCDAEREKE